MCVYSLKYAIDRGKDEGGDRQEEEGTRKSKKLNYDFFSWAKLWGIVCGLDTQK